MGFFYRTIRMVDHGIKPCYIFDGKPPELKGGVVSYLRPVGLLELTSSWPSDLHCGKRQRRARRKRRRRVGGVRRGNAAGSWQERRRTLTSSQGGKSG